MSLKKTSFAHFIAGTAVLPAFLLVACGGDTVEEVTQVNQMGMEVVEKVGDLPKCTKDNEGEQAFVKGETAPRICVDKKWYATKDSAVDLEFSCTTKQLKDKSGVKIICNGDSIGVVYNGKDGTDGKDGVGCTISGQNDTTVTITCGSKSTTINIGAGGGAVVDTAVLDSEKIATSLDYLAGYSQKGPFLKGSTVYLYELEDGRTLKQTNGNFTSNITRDDGYYKFSARDLVSQYALIVVDGHYRNEVTGKNSNTAIKLKAISDVHKHSAGANVNLLTHLEYERVYYLVTKKKMKVSAAKRQAQREILEQFHIKLDDYFDSESMDVFGTTEGDATLLAISILLQGDRSEADLVALLTEISNDMAEDGQWNDSTAKADSIRTSIAQWAWRMENGNLFSKYRTNVTDWKISSTVPNFEKYMRKFYGGEFGLGYCDGKETPIGTVKHVTNPKSNYFARSYTDVDTIGGNTRFICKDDGNAIRWQIANNIEKDTLGWGKETSKEGDVKKGQINDDLFYVYEGTSWRHGTNLDGIVGKGCVPSRSDTIALGSDNYWYKCIADTSYDLYEYDYGELQGHSAWRLVNEAERKNVVNFLYGECTSAMQDSVVMLDSISYRCDNDVWRRNSAF